MMEVGKVMDRGCFLTAGVGEIAEALGSSTLLTEHSHSPAVMIPMVRSFFHKPLLIVGNVSYLYGLGQNKS